jgi:hypothetical protein
LLSWIVRHSPSAATDGLITSKVLSLAPLVYELIDDFEVWVKPKLAQPLVLLPSEQATKKP